MRRFLIFPPVFAVWFLSAQFGLMVLNWAGSYASFYFFPPNVTYFLIAGRISPSLFTPAIMAGAIVGCVFSALELALLRDHRTPKETLLLLLRNGIKSGIVAVSLVLFCQAVLLVLSAQESHRRYHAYPQDIDWSNLIYTLQPLLLTAAGLWAMGKTLLKQPRT